MSDIQSEPLTLTPAGAAKHSGIAVHVIRDAVAAGLLKGIRIGRTTRIPVSELLKFVELVTEQRVDLAKLRKARRSGWTSNNKRDLGEDVA